MGGGALWWAAALVDEVRGGAPNSAWCDTKPLVRLAFDLPRYRCRWASSISRSRNKECESPLFPTSTETVLP